MSRPRTMTEPPSGYHLASEVDLAEDRSTARTIRLLFLAIAVGMMAPAIALDLLPGDRWSTAVTVAATIGACVVYMALHEATHGVLLRWRTGHPSTYSVRFPYLTTGNPALLDRRSFFVVALGPAVIWGVVLVALLAWLPPSFGLTAYVVLVLNVAGSAGDIVQTRSVARLPAAALVQDSGHRTRVYLPAPSAQLRGPRTSAYR